MRSKWMAAPLIAGLVLAAGASAPAAQEFPDGPVTMVVPFSTGGGNDTVARLMGQYIEEYLGARLVVQNQPGASGQVGWTSLAGEEPDGQTIGMISSPSIFLVELLRENVAFTLDDFQAIARIQTDPIIIMVNASGDMDDFDALVAKLEEAPGEVNVGGDGPQSNVHLQVVAFEGALDLDVNFVAYSGSGPSAEALLGNEVDVAFLSASSALPFIEAGRLRPLALISDQPHPAMPDVPLLSDVSGVDVPAVGTAIRGVIAPAGVPADRVAVLDEAFEALLQDEAFAARAAEIGIVTNFMGADEFGALLSELREQSGSYVDIMR